MRNKIQIAFDLGSYSIKSAVGRILPDGKIEVLSLAEIQSESIDCGDIIDKDLLLSHLEILIERIYSNKILNAKGIIIMHRHKKEKDTFPKKINIIEEKKYGISKIIFFTF